MSDKKINIEVLGVGKVKINDIEAKVIEDDGMTWFDTEDYKTVVFPTAESLLEAVQLCYQASENGSVVKNLGSELKEALKVVDNKEDLVKNIMYGTYINDNLEELDMTGKFLEWAEYCFYMNIHRESFIEPYYKEIIPDTLGDDLLEIENKQGIEYIDRKEMSEYWLMDWSDGIYTYGLEETMFLYHLTEEEKEQALKEIESNLEEKPMTIKGLVKVIEEILELADILEK